MKNPKIFPCKNCENCKAKEILSISDLSEEQTKKLQKRTRYLQCKKGDVIFQQGDPVDAIYVITKGRIKLTRYDAEGREQIVGIFAEGETIWEGVVQDDSHFPFSGISLTSSRICVIYKEDFMEILRNPNTALQTVALLSKKLHDANERNILLSTKDPKVQVASFLLYRKRRSEGNEIDLTLDDIAGSLGIRAETVSRKLKELMNEGYIKRTGKSSIEILNYEGLENLS